MNNPVYRQNAPEGMSEQEAQTMAYVKAVSLMLHSFRGRKTWSSHGEGFNRELVHLDLSRKFH